MTLVYDPLATLPANYVIDEIQVTNGNAIIFPAEHPFYLKDFQIWATAVLDSIEVELLDTLEFSLSPSFMIVSSDVGIEAYSFIVLLNPSLWSDVRITYRGAGGGVDSTLAEEILKNTTLDKTDPGVWLDLIGDSGSLRTNELDISYRNKGIIETISESVDLITNGLNRDIVLPTTTAGTDAQVLVDAAEINAAIALVNATEALEFIEPPTIVAPIDDFINFDFNNTIDISGFITNSKFIGTHTATDWEISTDVNFLVIAHGNYDDPVNLTSYYPLDLIPLTKYYVRTRLVSDGHKCNWSNVITFTTAAILSFIIKPTITSPADSSINILPLPVLQADAFTVFDRPDNHVSTDWQISDVIDFTNIVYEKLNSTDLESHTVEIPLVDNTTHYVRCRYNGYNFNSVYSDGSSFTVIDVVEAINSIGGVK